jgi:hypothetical protein
MALPYVRKAAACPTEKGTLISCDILQFYVQIACLPNCTLLFDQLIKHLLTYAMSATADSKLAARHTIKVIPPESLPAHLRPSQQHYDKLLSAESSPLLSPPPPYRQYEQDIERAVWAIDK